MKGCRLRFLVGLLVPLLLLGLATPCLAAGEGILLEAESMQPVTPHAGWEPIDHYTGWYEKTPSGGRMLCGSSGPPGEARGEIEVPEQGTYRLWVRYLDLIRYRGPFEVIVRQEGRERARQVFDRASMRTSAAGKARWGRGYACFVWASMDVTLEAGKAEIVVAKLPPWQTTRVSRTLDCFVLASDRDYVPSVHDFVPPLYLRVVMGRGHRKGCFIHIFGRRPPPPHFIEHHNLTQAGLFPGPYGGILGRNATDADVQLTSHEATPWVDIAPLLAIQGLNRILLTAIRTYNQPLERADFTVEVATGPSRKHVIHSYRRKGKGAGLMLTVDLTRREEIRRDLDWTEETLAWARALPKPDGKRPKRFPVLTTCYVSPRTYAPDVVAHEIETLSRLGYPIDVVTEADLVGGDLEKRRFLVLGGSHIRRDAAAKIAAWVAKGGHLYLGPGTGAFDAFNAPLDLAGTFGFRTAPLEVTQTCGRAQFEFPRLRVLDRVDGGQGLLDVVCAKGAWGSVDGGTTEGDAPACGPVEVLARFADGEPAVLARAYGKGRVVASAFFVGLAYARSGAVRRKAQWEKDPAAKTRTFNPPSFDAGYRALFAPLVAAAGVERRCTTSRPLVEASVLAMPRGWVIALANWSGVPQRGLEVTLRLDRPLRKVVPAGLVLEGVRDEEGAVHLRVDLEAAGFLVVRTR